MPSLNIGYNVFREKFDVGSIHEFELRKGGLDFYQVNMAPIYMKIDEDHFGEGK